MNLDELDKLIADREGRIDKRKTDGTLFEDEVARDRGEDEDARLKGEITQEKKKRAEKLKASSPDCPQCGLKMTYMPEQSMVACQNCGIGMKV